MHCLHIINKHDRELFDDCLAAVADDDSLLFIEDAVYFLLDANLLIDIFQVKYCLMADVEARALNIDHRAGFQPCSDAKFVKLICQHEKSISWY